MKIPSIDGDKPTGLSVEVVLALAAAFVAGSIGRGKGMPIEQVNGMISGVHQHLIEMVGAGSQKFVAEAVSAVSPSKHATVSNASQPPAPFVPVAESIHDRYLVCLECGRRYETLTRHVATSHGLSDVDYRRRFGLPWNYPMICDHYKEVRAGLAPQAKLGLKKRSRKAEASAAGGSA